MYKIKDRYYGITYALLLLVKWRIVRLYPSLKCKEKSVFDIKPNFNEIKK